MGLGLLDHSGAAALGAGATALLALLVTRCLGARARRLRALVLHLALVRFAAPFGVVVVLFVTRDPSAAAGGPRAAEFAGIVGWVLAAGAVLRTLQLAVARWRLARWRRGAIDAPAAVQRVAEVLRSRLGLRSARVHVLPGLEQPLVASAFRPIVYLPPRVAALPGTEVRAILAHELAHVRHCDLWKRGAADLLSIVWWPHPLFWWLRRELRAVEEEACDALAVQAAAITPQRYAHSLLVAARSCAGAGAAAALGGLGEGTLRRRIVRLLELARPARPALSPWRRLGAATLGSLAIASLVVGARPGRALEPFDSKPEHLTAAAADPRAAHEARHEIQHAAQHAARHAANHPRSHAGGSGPRSTAE